MCIRDSHYKDGLAYKFEDDLHESLLQYIEWTPVSYTHLNGTEEIIEAHDMDKYSNQRTSNGASKIYLMARKNGMACRRLTWNPNYKGFDDWQLALRAVSYTHLGWHHSDP